MGSKYKNCKLNISRPGDRCRGLGQDGRREYSGWSLYIDPR